MPLNQSPAPATISTPATAIGMIGKPFFFGASSVAGAAAAGLLLMATFAIGGTCPARAHFADTRG
jgi:hypothetical protein